MKAPAACCLPPAATAATAVPATPAIGNAANGDAAGSMPRGTSENRTQVTNVFRSASITSVDSVNFAVSTGTVIPTTVTLVDIPAEIVRIVPAWRSYRVVRVRNQILIVEPSSRKIVEIITIQA